jgi:hypothetical protein
MKPLSCSCFARKRTRGRRRRETLVTTGMAAMYKGTSLTRNSTPLGPYSRTIWALWWPLGGGGYSYEQGTPVCTPTTDSERRGNHLKECQDFCLKANASTWPLLSCMCHIRSTVGCVYAGPTGRPLFSGLASAYWGVQGEEFVIRG